MDKTGEAIEFGRWLSRQRKARDLTQEELAERIGCSVWSIQKFEVGNRRPSKQLAEMLADFFHVPPAERDAFMRFARGREDEELRAGTELSEGTKDDSSSRLRPSSTINSESARTAVESGKSEIECPNNLPVQLTSFVGRAAELPRVCDLMLTSDVRLLTLTGPPGTGKTRLALQAAAELLRDFEDGVFFVNLAPINDPELVISEIAQALAIGEGHNRSLLQAVENYLRDKRLLLVLDNVEQVVEAGPVVGQLLMSSPRLKVMVTSRVPLHIRGEKEFAVPALHLPDLQHLPPLERLSWYEAVQLFIQRAMDVSAGFELTGENAPAVAQICARLDGLPLAIELAAARIKVLSPEAILSRLNSRLELLTGGPRDLPARQRTLRSAIEWSHDLLDHQEKKLFRRLGIFQSGASLEAIEEVCNPEGAPAMGVLDGVSSLVDKGLLKREEGAGGAPRFLMLETIHEYAREKLRESGEEATLQREHALYFMRLAEEAEPHLSAAGQVEWLHRLEGEHDNLRAALKWAGDEEGRDNAEGAEIGLRVAGALGGFWSIRGYLNEGREVLEGVLDGAKASDNLREARAKALRQLGRLIWDQGDLAEAQPPFEESLAIYRESGNSNGIARLLVDLGNIHYMQGELASVRPYLEEALSRFRESEDRAGIARALCDLGWHIFRETDSTAGRSMAEESLAIFRDLGNKQGISRSLTFLGIVAMTQGDYNGARALFGDGLAIDKEVGDKGSSAHKLGAMGQLAVLQGDYAAGWALYEESLAAFKELGDAMSTAWVLCNLGHAAVLEGDYAGALVRYLESLPVARKSADKDGVMQCLRGIGAAAAGMGQVEKGAALLGASEVLRESIGAVVQPDVHLVYERGLALTHAQLSHEEFERAWQKGRGMTTDDAIACALEG